MGFGCRKFPIGKIGVKSENGTIRSGDFAEKFSVKLTARTEYCILTKAERSPPARNDKYYPHETILYNKETTKERGARSPAPVSHPIFQNHMNGPFPIYPGRRTSITLSFSSRSPVPRPLFFFLLIFRLSKDRPHCQDNSFR